MSGSELKGGGPTWGAARAFGSSRASNPGRPRVYGDRRAGTGEATLIFCHKLTRRATGRVAGLPGAAPEIYSTFSGYADDLCSFDFGFFQALRGRLVVLLVSGPFAAPRAHGRRRRNHIA